MTDFMTMFLKMSVTASYTAIFVMVLRLLLRRAPKKYSYAMWAVVLFRMVCPFSFESVLSLIPETPQTVQMTQNNPPATMPNNAINAVVKTDLPNINTPIAAIETGPDLMTIFFWIWLVVGSGLVLWMIFSYTKSAKRLSTAIRESDNIYITDQIVSPFVFGLIKPKIYLPTNLSQDESEYIILHERYHIRRRDYLVKPLAYIALCLHWFNPVLWFAFYFYNKDMETSCDEYVLRHSKTDIRTGYSSALLSVSMKRSSLISPIAFGESNVKSRIKLALNYKRPAFWITIVSILLVVAVIIGLSLDPVSKKEKDNISNSESEDLSFDDNNRRITEEEFDNFFESYLVHTPNESYSERAYEAFRSHLLTFSLQDAILVFEDHQLIHSMLMDSYWFPDNSLYTYTGETNVQIDDRTFILQDIPENEAEEVVVKNFYYKITAEFDRLYETKSSKEAHIISIENTKEAFDKGRYTKSTTIHQVSITENQSLNNPNIDTSIFENWMIVNVIYTIDLCDAWDRQGPQWGDGTYSRDYLVGCTADDTTLKIYNFMMPTNTEWVEAEVQEFNDTPIAFRYFDDSPEFLSEEQTEAFLKAQWIMHVLYIDSSDIMYPYSDTRKRKTLERENSEGWVYIYQRSRYRYESFIEFLREGFTEEWVQATINDATINQRFIEDNGELCFIDGARGANVTFDRIEYKVLTDELERFIYQGTAYYFKNHELTEEGGFDTEDFTFEMILTDVGWRMTGFDMWY